VASDWVGVAGTAIGAGIGGVVTVASHIVRGRQDTGARREAAEREDRLRVEDRSWSVRQHRLDERRVAYADLLDAARRVRNNVEALAQHMASPGEWGVLMITAGREATAGSLDDFHRRLSRSVLQAVDRSVLDIADRIFAKATAIRVSLEKADGLDVTGDVVALTGLTADLENACRRDLGLDAPGQE
jgi:hypothetical protein